MEYLHAIRLGRRRARFRREKGRMRLEKTRSLTVKQGDGGSGLGSLGNG